MEKKNKNFSQGEKKMCNDCHCDNYELCSIVGTQPIGFCCKKCDLYDELHTCLKAKMAIAQENKHLLSKSFCIKMNKKMEYPEIDH